MCAWPGGGQVVRRGVGRPGQDPGEGLPAGGRRARDVIRVHHVQHAFEGAEDFMTAGQLHRQFVHQAAEGPHVLLQLPDRLVEFGDGDPAQPVLRFIARGRFVPVGGGREGPPLRQVGVGGRLDVEIDGHPAAQELQRNVLVPRRDRLDDGSVRAPGDAFALEAGQVAAEAQVHDDFHRGVRGRAPAVRNLPLEAQPFGAPRPAPGRSVLLGCELLPEGLQDRYRLIRDIPAAQGQRNAARIDRGGEAFANKAVEPDFRETTVVVQCDPLSAAWMTLKCIQSMDITYVAAGRKPRSRASGALTR